MSRITFKVTSKSLDLGYKMIGFDQTSLLMGQLKLSGAKGELFWIGGLHPDSPVVHPQTQLGSNPWGIIFVPFTDFQTYVDFVSREPELWVLLDANHVFNNRVVNYAISP
jgi:hypothetical protein